MPEEIKPGMAVHRSSFGVESESLQNTDRKCSPIETPSEICATCLKFSDVAVLNKRRFYSREILAPQHLLGVMSESFFRPELLTRINSSLHEAQSDRHRFSEFDSVQLLLSWRCGSVCRGVGCGLRHYPNQS